MGPLFTETITLYNHWRRGREESWTRTVICGVQVRQSVKHKFDNGKSLRLTETSITIPVNADAGDRNYRKPSEYSGTGWTLNPDDGQDLVVLGACVQEIGAGYTVDALIKEHGALTLTAAADNTHRPRLRHWKAVCA